MKSNSKTAVYLFFFTVLLSTLYRPLPSNFTDNFLDRTAMYIVEMTLRLAYVYPVR